MRRCRFDTLGKQTSAHLAGGPPPYKGWVPPARWVSADAASAGPPTARVGLQPTRTVGGVHPPCGWDISPPARWVGLFPAHNSEGLLLIEFSQESGRIQCLRINSTPVLLFLPWAGRQIEYCHKQEHAGVKYNCLQCDKSFSRKDNLKTHSLNHTGEKPHNMPKQLSCDVCPKTFARKSHLLRHNQAHGGVKYNCPLCNKSFSQNTSLKTNSRIHSRKTPYNCLQCSKSFSQKLNLKTHFLIHSGEKPHKCTHCDYSYSDPSSLKTHVKKHIEEKLYNCNQCEYETAHSNSLKMHKRKHIGEKLCHCNQCEYVMIYLHNLSYLLNYQKRTFVSYTDAKSISLNQILQRNSKPRIMDWHQISNVNIDIDIFGIALSISISIFFRIALSISIFSTSPYRYRYLFFQKCRYIDNRYFISIF